VCFKMSKYHRVSSLGNTDTESYNAKVIDLGPATCVMDGGKVTITPKKEGGERFKDASELEYGTVFKLSCAKDIHVKVREGAILINHSNGVVVWSHSKLNGMIGTIIGKAKITMGGVE